MVRRDLDKAIDLIDELESLLIELMSSSNVPPGLRLRIYQLLVDLREILTRVRTRL